MDYVQLTLDDYIQCKTEIKESLTGIVKSFVKIGWQLTRINASKAYTLDGYNSITEFAKAEYGMNPDGVSRFMKVYERYSIPGDTPELQEQYKDFKFAQLSEMLQLPIEDQQMITAYTKRDDIRELKKFNKENEHNPEQLFTWKNGQGNKIYDTIFEFFKSSRELLNTLFGSDAYRAGSLEQMVEIVNPSGSRSYRKGTVFLMMYGSEKGIMVKQIPQGTENMTWSEFFNIVQDLFGEKAAGAQTWEAYFEPKNQKIAEPKKEPSHLEDSGADMEITLAQVPDENEGKSQEIAPAPKTNTPEEMENPAPDVEKPENPVEIVENEEQIPGQDSILNHEEYMPKPEAESPEKIQESEHKEPVLETTENGEPEPAEPEAELPAEPEERLAVEAEEPPKEEIPDPVLEGTPEKEPQDQESEIAPAQEIVEKPIHRKEFLDSLTEYGAAAYFAKAFEGFGAITFSQLKSPGFWERWMNAEVDHLGLPWVD